MTLIRSTFGSVRHTGPPCDLNSKNAKFLNRTPVLSDLCIFFFYFFIFWHCLDVIYSTKSIHKITGTPMSMTFLGKTSGITVYLDFFVVFCYFCFIKKVNTSWNYSILYQSLKETWQTKIKLISESNLISFADRSISILD